jgi:hypothetical protein
MPRITLKDDGFSYKKIMQGRNWIGRVYPKADGTFGAYIGKAPHVSGATEKEAFEKVGAAYFGFSSPEALRANNAAVRAKNKANRALTRDAVNRALAGDFAGFDKILKML